MIKLGDYVVTPTIFPDGTSQVWKIPEDVLKENGTVIWEFESEAELSHVLQLGYLLKLHWNRIDLDMPFMPYGRQDKEISNEATFARSVIVKTLRLVYDNMWTTDNHSKDYFVTSIQPDLKPVFAACKPDLVCFPDEGASKRGYEKFYCGSVVLEKDRDQLTGEIKGLKFAEGSQVGELPNTSVLIIDDICDGGRTFIEACKLLKGAGAKEVYLYTTHGIYSKGTKVLFDAGIDRIFNRKGEVTEKY